MLDFEIRIWQKVPYVERLQLNHKIGIGWHIDSFAMKFKPNPAPVSTSTLTPLLTFGTLDTSL
jgi:hypothetical protein